jgi:hypothetical protein
MSTTDLINQVRLAPSHKLAHELVCAKRILVARGSTDVAVKRFVEFVFKLRAQDRAAFVRAA